MAATWLRPLHSKGRSVAITLKSRTDYSMNAEKTVYKKVFSITDKSGKEISGPLSGTASYSQNPDKTKDGELIRGYECNPRTVVEEFMLTKKEYEHKTGRNQGDRDIIAYRIRQSFVPGEIEPEKALEVGYELGLRWTKGKHAFIVSVHTDKAHIHCHIDYNSTRLDGNGKFNNFKNSSFALQRLSDIICLEHGLSVIENPAPSKGKNYAKWMKEKYGGKEPSWKDKLRAKFDEILPSCDTFEDFLSAMKTAGYKINDKRKHITFLAEGQKQPTRLSTLKGEHTEEAIRRRIEEYLAAPKHNLPNASESSDKIISGTVKVSWLIDIQAKIQAGKGAGYEHWAHLFNIKETAKTLMFLKEQGIESYDELAEKAADVSSTFSNITSDIKAIETRQKEVAELQRQIGTYGKTRDTYNAYKRAGFDQEFYEKNRANITLHESARRHFDSLGLKKLPKISELKQEYANLQAQKKKLYASYYNLKGKSRELLVAKHNARRILDLPLEPLNYGISRPATHAESPGI